MKILLLGSRGLLGARFAELFSRRAIDFDAPVPGLIDASRADFSKYDFVVNAVSYTNVDEARISDPIVRALNIDFPAALALAAARSGSVLASFSTDYVFNGEKRSPYTEEDEAAPLNDYGLSKLAADELLLSSQARGFVFRTSTLYSTKDVFERPEKPQFLKSVLSRAIERGSVRVVDDQTSTPTSVEFLAEAVFDVLMNADCRKMTLLNAVPSGEASRFEFAREFLRMAAPSAAVLPTKTEFIKTPESAERPVYSTLDCQKLSKYTTTPDWKSILEKEYAEQRRRRLR